MKIKLAKRSRSSKQKIQHADNNFFYLTIPQNRNLLGALHMVVLSTKDMTCSSNDVIQRNT